MVPAPWTIAEATTALTESGSPARVLILTTFDLDEYVYAALRAGASGFLLKDVPGDQLIAGVRTVAAGQALLAPSLTRRLIGHYIRRPPAGLAAVDPVAALTAREREVLRLLARGHSNREIATALFLGEATVKTHVGRTLTKLGLRDRVQAVVFAYECGLIEAGEPDPPPSP